MNIQVPAPDGKTLTVQVPDNSNADQIQSITNDVLQHYQKISSLSSIGTGISFNAPEKSAIVGNMSPELSRALEATSPQDYPVSTDLIPTAYGPWNDISGAPSISNTLPETIKGGISSFGRGAIQNFPLLPQVLAGSSALEHAVGMNQPGYEEALQSYLQRSPEQEQYPDLSELGGIISGAAPWLALGALPTEGIPEEETGIGPMASKDAEFRGWQEIPPNERFPLYDITAKGPIQGSTVAAETLAKKGYEIPFHPPQSEMPSILLQGGMKQAVGNITGTEEGTLPVVPETPEWGTISAAMQRNAAREAGITKYLNDQSNKARQDALSAPPIVSPDEVQQAFRAAGVQPTAEAAMPKGYIEQSVLRPIVEKSGLQPGDIVWANNTPLGTGDINAPGEMIPQKIEDFDMDTNGVYVRTLTWPDISKSMGATREGGVMERPGGPMKINWTPIQNVRPATPEIDQQYRQVLPKTAAEIRAEQNLGFGKNTVGAAEYQEPMQFTKGDRVTNAAGDTGTLISQDASEENALVKWDKQGIVGYAPVNELKVLEK